MTVRLPHFRASKTPAPISAKIRVRGKPLACTAPAIENDKAVESLCVARLSVVWSGIGCVPFNLWTRCREAALQSNTLSRLFRGRLRDRAASAADVRADRAPPVPVHMHRGQERSAPLIAGAGCTCASCCCPHRMRRVRRRLILAARPFAVQDDPHLGHDDGGQHIRWWHTAPWPGARCWLRLRCRSPFGGDRISRLQCPTRHLSQPARGQGHVLTRQRDHFLYCPVPPVSHCTGNEYPDARITLPAITLFCKCLGEFFGKLGDPP